MQTPTALSCTSSNANGASGSLPAITVIQVEIMEMKLLQNLQISFWAKNGLVNIIAHIARRRGLDPFSIVKVYRPQQSPSSPLWKNAWPTQRPARAQTLMDPGLKLHLWIIHLSECVCLPFIFNFSSNLPTVLAAKCDGTTCTTLTTDLDVVKECFKGKRRYWSYRQIC